MPALVERDLQARSAVRARRSRPTCPRLGNRSGLEWFLNQWKEHKISDPTVAEEFNTYRFADHKEAVIALLQRVCIVSVETMQIIRAMPA